MPCRICGEPLAPGAHECRLCGARVTPAADTTGPRLDDPTDPFPPSDRPGLDHDVFGGDDDNDRSTAGQHPPNGRFRLVPLVSALVTILLVGALWGVRALATEPSPTSSAAAPTTTAAPPMSPSASTGTSSGSSTSTTPPAAGTGVAADLAPLLSVRVLSVAPPSTDSSNQPVSYGSENLIDRDPATAWRMEGDGSGTVVLFELPRPMSITHVGLVNGYAKLDPATGENRYRQGRRVLQVTWELVGVRSVTQRLTDQKQTTQGLDLRPTTVSAIKLHLDRVTTPGDRRFDYTQLSEVEIDGR